MSAQRPMLALVSLLFACGPGGTDESPPDTGVVHSCVWAQDGYCLEYNDRAEDIGVNVAEAEATCLANPEYFSDGGTTAYVAGPCGREVQGTSDAVARCVLPEEGESIIGGVRAGQPYVEIRYYYRGYGGYDFEPDPNTGADLDFISLEMNCRSDQGVFQRAPFTDFNWFVAPEIVAADHVCTPGVAPEPDAWDYTITTRGFEETNSTAALLISHDSGAPAAETHDLARDGATLSLHLVSTPDAPQAGVDTRFTCDQQPHLLWAVLAHRPEATNASACGQWTGADYNVDLTPLRGNCVVLGGP